jgi:hypothetical protein
MANVFIAVPHYDQLAPQSLEGLILATAEHKYSINTEGGSLLALVFNRLWVRALNRRKDGVTHFAMHHADVEAPAGWVDVLVNEMRDWQADVLSVVLPIKDQRGLTSTGLQSAVTKKIRRFTMTEVLNLPRTFDRFEVDGYDDEILMVNTGLWICNFTKPWVEKVCFHILDGITKDEDGTFQARAVPEDWNFSTWCAEQGLRVFATRAVAAKHHGRASYPNDSVWGTYQTDEGDKPVN